MAYRKLVVGDDVKIVKCPNWSGSFGKVLTTEGDFYKVCFQSWRDGEETHYFTSDKLLVSNGNPYAHIEMIQDDEDSFFHDDDLTDDERIMQQLLQRVATLEKQMLDVLKIAA